MSRRNPPTTPRPYGGQSWKGCAELGRASKKRRSWRNSKRKRKSMSSATQWRQRRYWTIPISSELSVHPDTRCTLGE
jgi:hypothetical protein